MEPKDRRKSAVSPRNGPAPKGRPGGTATKTRKPTAPRKYSGKTPTRRKQSPALSEVVYTQPDPFNKRRFLLRLLTVAAVALALFFGMSVFFKVDTVLVSGTEKYTPWQIREASGIKNGENLLSLNKARIVGKIRTSLPYVDKVRIGRKLPDTVNIEIVEIAVPYCIEEENGAWWLMAADGTLLESVNAADAKDYTQILGVKVTAPSAGQRAVAAEPVQPTEEATNATEETQNTVLPTEVITVPAAEKLSVALDILQYLEDNGILGTIATVDVEDTTQLEIWYGDRYQIQFGDSSRLSYKVGILKNTLQQLGEYDSGVLDISYKLRPDEVVYTPFS